MATNPATKKKLSNIKSNILILKAKQMLNYSRFAICFYRNFMKIKQINIRKKTIDLLENIQFLVRIILIVTIFFSTISCRKVFDYSVFSANVPKEYRDTRKQNLEKIDRKEVDSANPDIVCFALISDSHSAFNDLEKLVKIINNDKEIEFIIVGGDITDGGILDEYLIFRYIMEQSEIPYFTVIGNHDCLANGYSIYKEIYGPDDYILTYKNCKFVFFNDVVWELNHNEPEFLWFQDQLMDIEDDQNIFTVSHIAPWADSFTPLMQYAFTSIIDSSNVMLSIHGHHHDHVYKDYFSDGNDYLVIGSVDKKHYVKITVENNSYSLERIEY